MGLLHFIAVIAHAQVRMDGLTLSDLSDLSDSVTTITFDMKQITQQITTRGNATVALDKVGANACWMVDLPVLADCWRETVGFVWPAALPMFRAARASADSAATGGKVTNLETATLKISPALAGTSCTNRPRLLTSEPTVEVPTVKRNGDPGC